MAIGGQQHETAQLPHRFPVGHVEQNSADLANWRPQRYSEPLRAVEREAVQTHRYSIQKRVPIVSF